MDLEDGGAGGANAFAADDDNLFGDELGGDEQVHEVRPPRHPPALSCCWG